MAYHSTATVSERRNPAGKYRVWDFFRLSNETHPTNRRQPLQPRRKIDPTATKSASGIPYWPSRDPIEEEGGVNLYGFVGSAPSEAWCLWHGESPCGKSPEGGSLTVQGLATRFLPSLAAVKERSKQLNDTGEA